MGLNIKNPDVERLATEVATLSGVSKTEAIRRALIDSRRRLAPSQPRRNPEELKQWLESWWATLPPDVRGKRVTKEEREEILGYGPEGF